jgi:NDP-sugar pyrophosphorylase family protein
MRKMPDAIVLCGGAGLRLRSAIGDAPKTMARVSGRPFLELLLCQLRRYGFRRVILAVGYKREVIQTYFGRQAFGLDLEYSVESSPLGTGGALQNAAALVESDAAFVMNGDSYTDVDVESFVDDFRESNADASLVVVSVAGRNDCGSVLVDPTGKVERFLEKKNPAGSPYANAGLYLVSRRLLGDIQPDTQVSLEEDLFPRWLDEHNDIRAFVHRGECVDIGTPERFLCAQTILADVESEASMPGRGCS